MMFQLSTYTWRQVDPSDSSISPRSSTLCSQSSATWRVRRPDFTTNPCTKQRDNRAFLSKWKLRSTAFIPNYKHSKVQMNNKITTCKKELFIIDSNSAHTQLKLRSDLTQLRFSSKLSKTWNSKLCSPKSTIIVAISANLNRQKHRWSSTWELAKMMGSKLFTASFST